MTKRLLALTAVALSLGLVGCSATGAAWEGVRIGRNAAKKDSYLKIWIDGQEAKQNKLKKAYFGHASFKLDQPVSTSPSFKYDFIEPDRFGRITNVNLSIYQEYEGDFSHQAEFTVYPTSTDATTMLQPNTPVNLGSVPAGYKCMNFEKQNVPGVQLKPGLEYMLVFSVSGDRSETVQILFETR